MAHSTASAPAAGPAAVRPRGPLDARVRVPGSRSITNRALVCAALAEGESELRGAGPGDDTEVMRAGLRALGAGIEEDGDRWRVHGVAGRFAAPQAPLDVRLSGTTARFLTAAASLAAGPVVVDGAPRMRERPIRDLVDALARLGAPAEIEGRDGCPPVRVAGGGLPGGEAWIDARRSSQYVSGILLAAPYAQRDVALRFEEGVLVSRPFVELTVDVMGAFGAHAELSETGARVEAGRPYGARVYAVEPDAQSAVYAFAAAAIAGGRVVVEGIPGGSRQTDMRLLEVLARMGCRIERDPRRVSVTGPPEGLAGVDADLNDVPDAALALAVVAAFAREPSRLRNIANLRIKETDRLAALETELRRLGAGAEAGPDFLRVEPGWLRGTRIATYDDHRMAMAFALAGLRVPGVEIEDPGCVAKTWPDYFAWLERL